MTAQLSKKSESWSARFSEPVSDLVKRYTASVGFDKRLAEFDIQGSLAHAHKTLTILLAGSVLAAIVARVLTPAAMKIIRPVGASLAAV